MQSGEPITAESILAGLGGPGTDENLFAAMTRPGRDRENFLRSLNPQQARGLAVSLLEIVAQLLKAADEAEQQSPKKEEVKP